MWENPAVFQTRTLRYAVTLVTKAELALEEARQEAAAR